MNVGQICPRRHAALADSRSYLLLLIRLRGSRLREMRTRLPAIGFGGQSFECRQTVCVSRNNCGTGILKIHILTQVLRYHARSGCLIMIFQ